jgi:hypothetical protein
MTNFERLKSLESAYEMTDIIMHFLSTHYGEVIKGCGELNGLTLLHWLQEEYKGGNINE